MIVERQVLFPVLFEGEYEGIRIIDGLHFLYMVRGEVKPKSNGVFNANKNRVKGEVSMKRSNVFKVLLVVGLLGLGLNVGWALPAREAKEADETARQRVLETYGKLPLYFVENRGQIDSQVRYYTKTPGQAIYFTPEKIVFGLSRQKLEDRSQKTEEENPNTEHRTPSTERLSFSLEFLGANKEPVAE